MTFDLEKARADLGEIGDPKFCDCEVRAQFMEAITEIERLRTENRELLHEIKDLSCIIDTGYKQLVCDRTGLNERQDLPEGIRRMAARIQELEDAHKRSGVKYAKIINELRSSVYANTPGLKKQWDEILNTPANDKIGPSEEQIRAKMTELPSALGPYRPAIRGEAIRQLDVKPRSWQIPRNKKIRELEADIVKIKDILYYEKALTLLYWQRVEEGEKRSWEELLEEERTFRLEYAKKLLKNEHEEVDW
jgi:hypothetical protein